MDDMVVFRNKNEAQIHNYPIPFPFDIQTASLLKKKKLHSYPYHYSAKQNIETQHGNTLSYIFGVISVKLRKVVISLYIHYMLPHFKANETYLHIKLIFS